MANSYTFLRGTKYFRRGPNILNISVGLLITGDQIFPDRYGRLSIQLEVVI